MNWNRSRKALNILCLAILFMPAFLSYIQGSVTMLVAFLPVVALLYFRGRARINYAVSTDLSLPEKSTISEVFAFYSEFIGSFWCNFGLLLLAVVSSVGLVVVLSVF